MDIGRAAKASDLSPKTLRYYEDIKLVVANRKANGYRDYSDEHIHKLRFIQRMRDIGFSMHVCKVLLSLYEDDDQCSEEIRRTALTQIQCIETKISSLKELRQSLSYLAKNATKKDRTVFPDI